MVNLLQLEEAYDRFYRYLSERNKYSLKADVLKKQNPEIFEEFRRNLNGILAGFLNLEKNKGDLINIIEKRMDKIKDRRAIKRYSKLINDIPIIIKNVKFHLSRFERV